MNKKSGLPVERYLEIGLELKQMRLQVLNLKSELGEVFEKIGCESEPVRCLGQVEIAIDRVRQALGKKLVDTCWSIENYYYGKVKDVDGG